MGNKTIYFQSDIEEKLKTVKNVSGLINNLLSKHFHSDENYFRFKTKHEHDSFLKGVEKNIEVQDKKEKQKAELQELGESIKEEINGN